MKSIHRIPVIAGIGLRLAHLAEMAAARPSAGWLEIHPENFLANPHARELLTGLAARTPISVHTVGISIGSAGGIDRTHLQRMRRLIDEIDPILVSGHLAWSTYRQQYLNDLLPLPYTKETLQVVIEHVNEVQDALGRSYLIENPASYVGFCSSTMKETDFLAELARRTGCRLLCDVSNVVVSAHNMGYNAHQYIDDFPADAVDELHLGGFTPEDDPAGPGTELWIDTHAAAIAEDSWALYAYAVRRFGPRPTLIEWDNQIPALSTLLAEAAHADQFAQAVTLEAGHVHAR
jgi:uncharacterized protein (UPF0276 family)